MQANQKTNPFFLSVKPLPPLPSHLPKIRTMTVIAQHIEHAEEAPIDTAAGGGVETLADRCLEHPLTGDRSAEQQPSQPPVSEVARPILDVDKHNELDSHQAGVLESIVTAAVARSQPETLAAACEVPYLKSPCRLPVELIAVPDSPKPLAVGEAIPRDIPESHNEKAHAGSQATDPTTITPVKNIVRDHFDLTPRYIKDHYEKPVPCKQQHLATPATTAELLGSASDRSSPASGSSTTESDQQRPRNSENIIQYDREFMLGLRYAKQSLEKPSGMPLIPGVILDKPFVASQATDVTTRTPGKSTVRDYSDLAPRYIKDYYEKDGGNKSVFKQEWIDRRVQESGRDKADRQGPEGSLSRENGSQHNVKVIEIKREEPKLHQTDKAWKPKVKKTDDAEASETEELYRAFKAILNKLTPENMQILIAKVLDLPINTEERLKVIIDLVFEKVLKEQAFSVAYATMCKSISSIKVEIAGKPGQVVDFRQLLLRRCQQEFEKDVRDEEESMVKMQAIEKAETQAAKKQLQDEYNSFVSKARSRSLSNIKFIGEIFKHRMLTEGIMHECIHKLLKSGDEDSLECLSRLLTTIGKDLDRKETKQRIDSYFQRMKKTVIEKKTSPRVKFMLQDLSDLRMNNWVPRRADNNPKTIAQIHEEAAKEEEEKNQMVSQASNWGVKNRGSSHELQNQQRENWQDERGRNKESDDKARTVGSYKSNQNAAQYDPAKMKLSRQNLTDNSTLGPSGLRPNTWSASSRPSSDQGKKQP